MLTFLNALENDPNLFIRAMLRATLKLPYFDWIINMVSWNKFGQFCFLVLRCVSLSRYGHRCFRQLVSAALLDSSSRKDHNTFKY